MSALCVVAGCDAPRHVYASRVITKCLEHRRDAGREQARLRRQDPVIRERMRVVNQRSRRSDRGRATIAAYEQAHKEEKRSAERKRRAIHPELMRNKPAAWRVWERTPEGRASHLEASRRYRQSDKGLEAARRHTRLRRVVAAGVLLRIQVDADHCGICLEPLTNERFPSALATSIGHEPPLAVVRREGWLVVTERPEHLACNQAKHTRLDYERAA